MPQEYVDNDTVSHTETSTHRGLGEGFPIGTRAYQIRALLLVPVSHSVDIGVQGCRRTR
jgi:hypothetical protein